MKNIEYKGFRAYVEYNPKEEEYIGKVLDIKDLILFSAKEPEDIEKEFRDTIDGYLE